MPFAHHQYNRHLTIVHHKDCPRYGTSLPIIKAGMLPSFVVKDVGSVTGDVQYLISSHLRMRWHAYWIEGMYGSFCISAKQLGVWLQRQRLSTEFHGTGPARLGYDGAIEGSRWCCRLLQASTHLCVSAPPSKEGGDPSRPGIAALATPGGMEGIGRWGVPSWLRAASTACPRQVRREMAALQE